MTQRDRLKKLAKDHRTKLAAASLEILVSNMFNVLDRIEESDSGNEFHPVTFSSCRLLDGAEFERILHEMKSRITR